jgi:hypothetical protein
MGGTSNTNIHRTMILALEIDAMAMMAA